MENDLHEAADACLSLAYKYVSLIDCVESQRPQLLSDPTLAMLALQRKLLEDQFEARVRELANQAFV
jgi:hypothetical protein